MKIPVVFAFLLLFALAPPLPASAQNGIDFSRAGRDEVFKDLPGVVTTQEHEARGNVVCVQRYIDPPVNRWREPRRLVYSCTQDGLTFESNQAPYSRDREMRGLGW